MLKSRSQSAPNDVAYTFFDYDQNPAGFVETLTWSQVHQRARVVAAQLSRCGSPGDRAAILAPQGLDYIVAFFGAVEAGFIAVPLPVPSPGRLDERALGAMGDCAPAAILTTSAVVETVLDYAHANPDGTVPVVIEVDALDFEGPEPAGPAVFHEIAYLQYTSGSTGQPAGVVISHQNVISNLAQMESDYFEHLGGVPKDLTMVSWLPFYHDMGLVVGLLFPLGFLGASVLMSPTAFLQKPARWLQHIAANPDVLTAAPNFAFDVAARRTSDADLAGLDFSRVVSIISGSERVQPSTVRRLNDRLGPYGLPDWALNSSYGLAEATVYVVTSASRRPPLVVRFDVEKLTAGHAEECSGDGADLVGCGVPRSCSVRIVDPETRVEVPAGAVGEIWVQGGQVGLGYWRNPKLSERKFGGHLAQASTGTPGGRWLRTGDLGVIFKDELFVIGRIKDLLIVDGRNHYPDDIEATISAVTGGRVAAVSVPDESTEKLVAMAELKLPGVAPDDVPGALREIKRRVNAAVSNIHGVRVWDLVLVGPGSLPITTSGKIRRSACADRYRSAEFSRLDALV